MDPKEEPTPATTAGAEQAEPTTQKAPSEQPRTPGAKKKRGFSQFQQGLDPFFPEISDTGEIAPKAETEEIAQIPKTEKDTQKTETDHDSPQPPEAKRMKTQNLMDQDIGWSARVKLAAIPEEKTTTTKTFSSKHVQPWDPKLDLWSHKPNRPEKKESKQVAETARYYQDYIALVVHTLKSILDGTITVNLEVRGTGEASADVGYTFFDPENEQRANTDQITEFLPLEAAPTMKDTDLQIDWARTTRLRVIRDTLNIARKRTHEAPLTDRELVHKLTSKLQLAP